MAKFESQKAEKLTIEDTARKQLDGVFLSEFEEFVEFLKEENIRLAWKSINGFKATYKSKGIASIGLCATGWRDNAVETRNHVSIDVLSAGGAQDNWGGFDEYLEGQPGEVVGLFKAQISNKCVHCRPTCGCSQASGRTVHVSGKHHENVCMNAPIYKLYASGNGMNTMTLCSPCAVYPPIAVRTVPLGTVKKMVLARKAYIEKILQAGK